VDYNDVELVAFWVLSCAPGVLLTLAGIVAHKRSYMWIPGYLIVGILGCFIYAAFLGALIVQLFPPPDVPRHQTRRGLDLRGVGFVIGSWIGGIAGVVCALITAAGSSIVLRVQAGRARKPPMGL
jgi:hypothetical protein